MRSLPLVGVIAVLSLTAVASNASPEAERELRKLNAEYDQAIMRGDAAALDRIFADEFIYTNPRAEVLDKAQQLAALTSGAGKLEGAKSDDVRIRIYGETAVMTGRFTARAQSGGQTEMIEERYTAVWVRRDVRWQLVAEQGNLKK